MKILALSNLYPPDFLGGYEIGCAQVVDALIARGHDVRVLTGSPRKPVPSQAHVDRSLRFVDVYSAYAQHPSAPLANRLLDAESRLISAHNVHVLAEELERFAPDAVYVNNVVAVGGLGLIACLDFMKAPWVWHLGDDIPRILTEVNGTHRPALAEAISQLDGQYIAVSRRLLDEVESDGIDLSGKVEILPYWITGSRSAERTAFYRPGEHLRVIWAGQVNRNKGADVLIEAAGLLRDRGCDRFSVDFYGLVTDPELPKLVTRLDLEDRVALKGPRPPGDLNRLYGQYDVLAFPTWEREPFGLVPIEAAARGCVPVISRSCGVGEFLVHGVHCLKAERSPESFADALGGIVEGRVDLAPLARRGYAAVWRDFHIDGHVDRLEELLERAARTPRDGAGSAAEAYHLALLAEKLARVLIQEPGAA